MSSRNSARRKKENVRFEKESLVTVVNFFSPKGIHFTTSSSNPSVLLQYLHPGKIRCIKRTGSPMRIR